jgi:hypothetical protein
VNMLADGADADVRPRLPVLAHRLAGTARD